MSEIVNLLMDTSPNGEGETIETLLSRPGFRLERIVSRGDPSPEGFWYDQNVDEWVMLCRGRAMLRYDAGGVVELAAGDSLVIPAKQRHRVDWVSDDAVWLALHVSDF